MTSVNNFLQTSCSEETIRQLLETQNLNIQYLKSINYLSNSMEGPLIMFDHNTIHRNT